MKKVLHIISTDVYSGAENVACQIINMFKNEYDMAYVSKIGSNRDKLEALRIKYIPIKKLSLFNLKKVIKREQPDILHAHDARSCVISSFFAKKCKIVGHIHANHENMRTKTLKSFLIKILAKRMDKIIWVTASAYEEYYYKENVKNNSIVLDNVIDVKNIKKDILKDDNEYPLYDLVYLGRLSYQKDPLRLIEILRELKKNKENVKMAIIGAGEYEEEMKKMIDKYHLNDNVDMHGFVSNPYKILSSAKIMIMTSRYEGLPMCALEAMALGLPIVSTPTDGLKSVIEHGKNGYFGKTNTELANYILEILENKKNLEFARKCALEKNSIVNNLQAYKKSLKRIYENEK